MLFKRWRWTRRTFGWRAPPPQAGALFFGSLIVVQALPSPLLVYYGGIVFQCPVKNKPVRSELTPNDIRQRLGQKMLLHCSRCGGVHSFTPDHWMLGSPQSRSISTLNGL
jgi:hypothetical protein